MLDSIGFQNNFPYAKFSKNVENLIFIRKHSYLLDNYTSDTKLSIFALSPILRNKSEITASKTPPRHRH